MLHIPKVQKLLSVLSILVLPGNFSSPVVEEVGFITCGSEENASYGTMESLSKNLS